MTNPKILFEENKQKLFFFFFNFFKNYNYQSSFFLKSQHQQINDSNLKKK